MAEMGKCQVPTHDYGCAASFAALKQSDWAKIMATLSAEIDYTNFKSEIEKHADQRDKLNAYLIIGRAMLRLQKMDSPSKPPEEPPSVFPEDWGAQNP
jgi:hypothetical protein